jgi:hypothetical protein
MLPGSRGHALAPCALPPRPRAAPTGARPPPRASGCSSSGGTSVARRTRASSVHLRCDQDDVAQGRRPSTGPRARPAPPAYGRLQERPQRGAPNRLPGSAGGAQASTRAHRRRCVQRRAHLNAGARALMRARSTRTSSSAAPGWPAAIACSRSSATAHAVGAVVLQVGVEWAADSSLSDRAHHEQPKLRLRERAPMCCAQQRRAHARAERPARSPAPHDAEVSAALLKLLGGPWLAWTLRNVYAPGSGSRRDSTVCTSPITKFLVQVRGGVERGSAARA